MGWGGSPQVTRAHERRAPSPPARPPATREPKTRRCTPPINKARPSAAQAAAAGSGGPAAVVRARRACACSPGGARVQGFVPGSVSARVRLLPDTLTGSRARAPRRTCAQREGGPRAAAHLPRHGRRIARRGALKRRRCLLMRLFPRAAWLRTPTLGSNWHYNKSSDLVLRDVDFFECGERRSATQDERTFADALARTWLPSRVGCACVV